MPHDDIGILVFTVSRAGLNVIARHYEGQSEQDAWTKPGPKQHRRHQSQNRSPYSSSSKNSSCTYMACSANLRPLFREELTCHHPTVSTFFCEDRLAFHADNFVVGEWVPLVSPQRVRGNPNHNHNLGCC